jgi:Tir chaperone protein (CesT) family
MSKEKINETLEEFGRRYGFVAQLNEDNICALTADGVEKVYVEYIEDSDRVTVYANLFAYSDQALEMDQLKLVMLMNIELFAKTGGIVALHPLTESPVLCWGADADVLPSEALINVLLNLVELIKIVRDKLDLRESSGDSPLGANAGGGGQQQGKQQQGQQQDQEEEQKKSRPGLPSSGARPNAAPARPAAAAVPAAAKPAGSPTAAKPAPAAKPASSGNSLQDMLMNQIKK